MTFKLIPELLVTPVVVALISFLSVVDNDIVDADVSGDGVEYTSEIYTYMYIRPIKGEVKIDRRAFNRTFLASFF